MIVNNNNNATRYVIYYIIIQLVFSLKNKRNQVSLVELSGVAL